MSCLRICLSLWWWSSGYAYPRRFRVLELSFRKTLKCHFCSSCYRARGIVWEVRGNVTPLSFSWLWWGSSGLSGPISNLLSSLRDAYLRYLRESLRGLQLFRCDIWGFWRQGKRMVLGSPVAPSSSWFCAPFTLSLLNRHNSGEDLTGGLLRVAKTACIGSSCPLSILQLPGVFCRGWFPLWFCNSTGGTFITSVAVCLWLWCRPPHLRWYIWVIHTLSKLCFCVQFFPSLLQKKGFLSKVQVEGELGGEWRCKLVLRGWKCGSFILLMSQCCLKLSFQRSEYVFQCIFYCDVYILLFMLETKMCIFSLHINVKLGQGT